MSRKFLTNVDLTGLQLGNLRLENRTSDPTTAYGKGHVYFNTTNNELRWYSGTAWVGLGVSVTDAIAAEATARIAGDAATLSSANSALSSAIATEVTNRNSAITTAVSNLVASAPAALDTLNEIAAALGNDASLSTTLTNSIATKLSLAGGTMTGTLAMGANKITSTYYAVALDDMVNKAHLNDTVNGGVGYGIGVAQAYTDTKIAQEVLDRNVNIANAKNEAVGISQTYTNTRETAITTAYQAYADQAEVDAKAYTDTREAAEITARNTAISTHNSATTSVHGIANTANLATKAYADAAVAVEVTDRTSAISAAIATEVTNRNTAISTSVSAAIATEVTDRNAAITSAVSTETTNRNSAIAANSVTDKAYTDTKIATEVTDRNTAIGVETTNRGTAISSAISTEVTDRNTAIAAEASLRITGDSTTLTSANTYTDGKFTALTSSAVPEGTHLYY